MIVGFIWEYQKGNVHKIRVDKEYALIQEAQEKEKEGEVVAVVSVY
jgi:precorrin-3B methylase